VSHWSYTVISFGGRTLPAPIAERILVRCMRAAITLAMLFVFSFAWASQIDAGDLATPQVLFLG
jgi:hypothetical protein